MVSRYFVYKQALLEEAERLVQAHVLREKDHIFYLTFQELQDVVRTNHVDDQLIRQRKDAFKSYQALTPPRVLTLGWRGHRRGVPTRRLAGRCAGRLTGFGRDH
jgi:pyruvate,water dikinase